MKSLHIDDTPSMSVLREHFIEVMARHDLIRENDGFDKYRKGMNEYVSNLIQKKLN